MTRKTKISDRVTDEELAKVNPDNLDLLEDFIEYLKSIDRAEGTIINYTSDIKICFVWALHHTKNKFFVDFTKRDVIKYQNYMLNTLELSSARVRRLRATLSSMSNYVENILDDEFPEFRNIIGSIEAPTQTPVRKKTILTDEQAQSLLDHLVEKGQYQQACMFALAWASGARKSELLRFKIEHFDDDNIMYGSLYKTNDKIKTKGRGTGGKMIHKYVLVGKFKPYFDLWTKEREKLGVDCESLFVIQRRGVWGEMKQSTLETYANHFARFLDVPFYFHCMRHNFTTGLSQAGIPAEIIKDIVGWESVEMVSTYDDTDVDDELGKYFGDGGIKQVESKSLSDL